MAFTPKYTITSKILKASASLEIARHDMIGLPLTATMIASLRESARLASTHHSTAIEGNRLSPSEIVEVVHGGGHFPNRQKDEIEVLNYYKALDLMEFLAKKNGPVTEEDIQLLHGTSVFGKKKPTPYRDGQNVIRSGKLVVYIPPKASDVPTLMQELIAWINAAPQSEVPIPFIAGLAHYQFATIHPYYDGNGRTARLFATLILHKFGYGLKGIYCLEEYYARDLEKYYQSLTVGTDEDYYDGERATSDLTEFLEYFVQGMADAFDVVRIRSQEAQKVGALDQTLALRTLSSQQRRILTLFLSSQRVSSKEIAEFFKISPRQAQYLCKKWVLEGFFEVARSAPKIREYQLSQKHDALIQSHQHHPSS